MEISPVESYYISYPPNNFVAIPPEINSENGQNSVEKKTSSMDNVNPTEVIYDGVRGLLVNISV
ncbi:MAG: hypothetical protein H7A23_15180 [Leptospiraceae bacterium]|nr:hypothetical protein [Leptospiraceae bacterium]MCP5495895.1 hypothetical protein [Leptospiraceae bacterium]